jgi:hypothetical protein
VAVRVELRVKERVRLRVWLRDRQRVSSRALSRGRCRVEWRVQLLCRKRFRLLVQLRVTLWVGQSPDAFSATYALSGELYRPPSVPGTVMSDLDSSVVTSTIVYRAAAEWQSAIPGSSCRQCRRLTG